jgi:hypothetical protein
MRRLPRILLNAATVGSLVLFVAACVLWVRSYGTIEGYQVVTSGRLAGASYVRHVYGVRSTTGTIYLGVSRERGSVAPTETVAGRAVRDYYRLADESNVETFWKRRLGFDRVRRPNGVESWILAVPYPVLAVTTAIPVLLRVLRPWHRQRPGLCPACGYDLRATPRRCPECGTPAGVSQ